MKKRLAIILISIMMTIAGCGSNTSSQTDSANVEEKSASADNVENSTKEQPEASENDEKHSLDEKNEDVAAELEKDNTTLETEDNVDGERSLAKRLCGKYSYHASSDDEEELYYIINMVSFGDNLYGFCGEGYADDNGDIYTYSFWVSEFIPFIADNMTSTAKDSVEVNELCFSIMSNAGMYWNSGLKGTITYTDEGLVFEGFDGDGILCPENDSRLFLKDDHVEDVFVYVNNDGREGPPPLQGLWSADVEGSPVYMEFQDSNLAIYQKKNDDKVFYAVGGCDFSDGEFSCSANILGDGGMPYEINAEYEVNGDLLNITFDSDAPCGLPGSHTFSKAKESDIHVITMDEVKFNEDSFGMYGGVAAFDESDFNNLRGSYYGVFIFSSKNVEDCYPVLDKLGEKGVDVQVIYTPDFEKLNPEPYYVVATRLYEKEDEVKELLEQVKAAGYSDAYIKFTGDYIGEKFSYTMTGIEEIEVRDDCVVIKDVAVSPPFWTSGEFPKMTLYIDKDGTKFGENCDFSGFSNYEKGDTPYDWFTRNYKLMGDDPDAYISNGPALLGVFEIGLDGNHITDYYGSYWWD